MHKYSDTKLLPYSTEQLFDLVIDIEKYPQFLPWCRAARILERHEDYLVAELIISFKHISESYVSKVTFKRPKSQTDDGFINVDLVRGPFSHLENHWQFKPTAESGSEICLHLAFGFRSRLLDAIIGLMFGKACAKMVGAFKDRAEKLYKTSA